MADDGGLSSGRTRDEEFVPIAHHGMIGDLRTAALVATDGTVDWYCPGRFDEPSVFAAVLDPDVGGGWRIEVEGTVRTQQFYLPETAVLATRFLTETGVVEVHDVMPVLRPADPDHRSRLVRRIGVVRGRASVRTRIAVRPDYGRGRAEVETGDDGVLVTADGLRLGLSATVDVEVDDAGDHGPELTASFRLESGQDETFVLETLAQDAPVAGCDPDTQTLVEDTSRFWHAWLAQSTYRGRWRESVNRSAITLKMLTHEPSGAVVAAPTTSLPEEVGGERNWDYRYVWIRDAAFTLYALLRLGFTEEANAFVRWLSERLGEDHDGGRLGPLRVLYDIDGSLPTEEVELDHLRGHLDSRPVRAGNAAVDQLQLDIYGELIDSVYLFNKYGEGISHDAWADLRRVLDWVLEHWDDEDAGMWEIRSRTRAHTTSRLMVWVAIERMIRMARQRGLPGDVGEWSRVRDAVYDRIHERSWNEEIGAFTQSEGGTALDAGVLLMPMVKFCSPTDPRFLSTLDAVEDRLVADSLVFRYDLENDDADDGLDGEEGTFSLCSFWYVEALTRVGRLQDAQVALEKMFTYANHVGLYAEEVGLTGEQLGNFPQAFTHLALISAAINLDLRLG